MANSEEEIARGNKAGELLRNDVFQEAFDSLREHYIEQWTLTSVDEFEKRERLHVSVAVLEEIQSHIESIALTGKMAADQITAAKEGRYH